MNQAARTHNFNVVLNPSELEQLRKMAAADGLSAGAVIRQALAFRFKMTIGGQPICANGRPCFVAHLHPTTPQPITTGAPANVGPHRQDLVYGTDPSLLP